MAPSLATLVPAEIPEESPEERVSPAEDAPDDMELAGTAGMESVESEAPTLAEADPDPEAADRGLSCPEVEVDADVFAATEGALVYTT